MTPADLTPCAYCPRLCRHTCPVTVATGREAATPGAILTAILLTHTGARPAGYARPATDLCLGCGACEAHCKVHRPVPALVREARGALPMAEPLAEVRGDAHRVCVLTDGGDWSARWGAQAGAAVATLRTGDELGFAAWIAGDDRVRQGVAAHLAGRIVITASAAVAAVASAAGLGVERLPAPREGVVFPCCVDDPRGTPDHLACCGRREGFAKRNPAAAAAVAEENVRLLDGRVAACADSDCAAWLRAHGGRVRGPLDPFLE